MQEKKRGVNASTWAELEELLARQNPTGALRRLQTDGELLHQLPELMSLEGVVQPPTKHPEGDVLEHTLRVLEQAAHLTTAIEVRLAALVHGLGKANTPSDELPKHQGHEEKGIEALTAMGARMQIPPEPLRFAILATRWHGRIHDLHLVNDAELDILAREIEDVRGESSATDVAKDLALLCIADSRGRLGHEADEYPQAAALLGRLALRRSAIGR